MADVKKDLEKLLMKCNMLPISVSSYYCRLLWTTGKVSNTVSYKHGINTKQKYDFHMLNANLDSYLKGAC
jgi:hypothetical protein